MQDQSIPLNKKLTSIYNSLSQSPMNKKHP